MKSWQENLAANYSLDNAQIALLELLLKALLDANTRSLTSVSSPDDIVKMHFLDSLSLLNTPEFITGEIVDIGSGAGFPGLPLAIARPELKFTLIEANHKKVSFIEEMISILGLKNVKVLAIRAEDAGHSHLRESFAVAVARAVGSLSETLEYCLPLLKKGGYALLQRGLGESGDEHQAALAATILGGELSRVERVKPYSGAKNLHLWVFCKTGKTPVKYPRKPGIPRKRRLP